MAPIRLTLKSTDTVLYSVLNSKQKQLHGHTSNKMHEPTLSWIGNFEEKMDLSHIYLAVTKNYLPCIECAL